VCRCNNRLRRTIEGDVCIASQDRYIGLPRPHRLNALLVITGPPNEPVLLCSLASVICRPRLPSSVTLPAGGRAGHRARGRSVADTERRASTVTSRHGDTLFIHALRPWLRPQVMFWPPLVWCELDNSEKLCVNIPEIREVNSQWTGEVLLKFRKGQDYALGLWSGYG